MPAYPSCPVVVQLVKINVILLTNTLGFYSFSCLRLPQIWLQY